MEFKAEEKFVRISPKKLRPLAREIKGFSVEKALTVLPFATKKGAGLIEKVVKSAAANAVQKGAEFSGLTVKEVLINEGPRLKRGRPVSRGQWHQYKRRLAHIRVVLEGSQLKKVKEEAEEKNTVRKTESRLQERQDRKTKEEVRVKKENLKSPSSTKVKK